MNAKILSLASLAALTFLTGCDQLKDLTYTTTPNPLEMHGDSVAISVSVSIPPKGIKKKVTAEMTPKLGDVSLGSWLIHGEKVEGNGQSISFKPGGTATFTDVVAYHPSMENTQLVLTGKVLKGGKEKDALPQATLADATIVTPLLVQREFQMMFQGFNLERESPKSVTAEINFLKGQSEVRANETKDKDITDLITWMVDAQKNPKITITGIDIKGFASPDGEESKNGSLSEARYRTARAALITLFKAKKFTSFIDSSSYATEGRGEDFDGFKEQLNRTKTISESEKNLLLRVITMNDDAAQREQQMKDLGKVYQELEREVFPSIRRAIITVSYTEKGPSDEEYLSMVKAKDARLTADEWVFISQTLVKSPKEKAVAVESGLASFSTDPRLLNNAGALAYQAKNYAVAKDYFQKSSKQSDNDAVKNNIAGIYMMDGDRNSAKATLDKVKNKGVETKYNQGILSVLDGKYDAAVTLFGSAPSYNAALALVLNGKLSEASKKLEASEDKNSAKGLYLKAIIASRNGEGVESVVKHLTAALSKDASLKIKAANDREFVKFANDTSFSAAIK
ncbi:MAG: tetratricopeptide repeat protein [Flavobacteriales bacterium]